MTVDSTELAFGLCVLVWVSMAYVTITLGVYCMSCVLALGVVMPIPLRCDALLSCDAIAVACMLSVPTLTDFEMIGWLVAAPVMFAIEVVFFVQWSLWTETYVEEHAKC